MRILADLHVHSRYSRATSKELAPETLASWARIKGLAVVGSGDITHPAWLEELAEKLEPAEEGLFVLKPGASGPAPEARRFEAAAHTVVRFALTGEISTIYKAAGSVRKVHHLILVPDFAAARRLQIMLGRVGNITSDGRPILGLDSRDLLEILLEASPEAILIPAHIWTPWFSTLGDKSGFDSIEACYRDLTPYIHAVETGLSSDPPMNWRCSFLDRFTIVSNSDAHSAEKLGREATIFDTELSYPGLKRALEYHGSAGSAVVTARVTGTIEFFPEEGKYHLDGHRACGVLLEPRESIARRDLCPVCGKRLTIGVLHRVEALADRDASEIPKERPTFFSTIPLAELLAELEGTSPSSKRVRTAYARLLAKAGSELEVLLETPIERLRSLGEAGVAEAVQRMREGRVYIRPGFDGEYGVLRVFTPALPVEPKARRQPAAPGGRRAGSE